MFITVFTLICAAVAAACSVGLLIHMDEMKGRIVRLELQLIECTNILRNVEESTLDMDLDKLDRVLHG